MLICPKPPHLLPSWLTATFEQLPVVRMLFWMPQICSAACIGGHHPLLSSIASTTAGSSLPCGFTRAKTSPSCPHPQMGQKAWEQHYAARSSPQLMQTPMQQVL